MQALFQTDSWEDQMHKNTPSLTGALFAGALSAAVTIVVLFSSIGFWALLAACVSGPTIGFLAYKPVELWKSFTRNAKNANKEAQATLSYENHLSWIIATSASWILRPTQLIFLIPFLGVCALEVWTSISHLGWVALTLLLTHWLYTGLIVSVFAHPCIPENFRAGTKTDMNWEIEKDELKECLTNDPRSKIVARTIRNILEEYVLLSLVMGFLLTLFGVNLTKEEYKQFNETNCRKNTHWGFVWLSMKRDCTLFKVFIYDAPIKLIAMTREYYDLLWKQHKDATMAFLSTLRQEITVVCKVYIGAMFLWALSLTHSSERVIAAIDGTLGVLITFAAFSWIGGPHFLEAGVLWQFPFLSCGAFLGVLIGLINYELVAIRWLPKAQEKLADLRAEKSLLFNPSM